MKLSAPPPPPPEQPEPNQPTPGENPPADAPTPPTDANNPQPAPVALTWPSWFPGADFLLAALAILLAFLLASFVARNADLWVHLAAGKRLLAGEYRPGTDPFSYSAADRPWVNHSLLFDVGTYLLYRGNGMLLVVVKALAVALAFGLVIGIRRLGHSLWPWAAVAVVAVLAAAPRFLLNPMIGSMLLLAVTLFLLFRMPHRPGSWRFPIAIGITFWLWANVDSWFIIGPFALALVLVGELIEKKLWMQSGSENPDAEPIGQLPDVPTLAKALGIGIVACMLNPHHVRVWELPFELAGASGMNADYRIRLLLYTPLDSEYSASTPRGRALGYNINGLAYAALLFGGGAALALGAGRVRLAHVGLGVGFALLSLASIYAIPFFALVAVPIIASQLNAISTRVTLTTWGDPKSRFLLLGSAGGRVVCVIATLLACAMAWPGWMHPDVSNPAFARRVAWAVGPDPAMVKAAEQLQTWRAEGKLPDDARGVIASLELASYCAWFAPSEKVFINSRHNHHRAELPAYIALRSEMGLLPRDEAPDPKKVDDQLRALGAQYVVHHTGPGDGLLMRALAFRANDQQWRDSDRWSLWYLDGRTAVCGWRYGPGAERPSFSALRINPVSLAFGRGAERLTPGTVRQLPALAGWEDEFIRGANMPPPAADEAIGWVHYADVRRGFQHKKGLRHQAIVLTLFAADHLVGGGRALTVAATAIPRPAPDDELAAIPFLALRAAQRAIAADPDHPDGYYALSVVLDDPGLPLSVDEKVLGRITALRQFLMRVPPPDRYRRNMYIGLPSQAASDLTDLYLGGQVGPNQYRGLPVGLPAFQTLAPFALYFVDVGGRFVRVSLAQINSNQNLRVAGGPYLLPLDMARDMLLLAEKYASVDSLDGDTAKLKAEGIQERLKALNAQVDAAKNAYEREKLRPGRDKLAEHVRLALELNLIGEALRLLTDKDTDLNKEFERGALEVTLTRIALEMATGQLEDAATDIAFRTEEIDKLVVTPEMRQRVNLDALRALLRNLTYQKFMLEGNYAEAGAMLDSKRLAAGGIGEDPPLTPEQARLFPAPTPLAKAAGLLQLLPAISTVGSMVGPSPLDVYHGTFLRDLLINRFRQRQQLLNNRRDQDGSFYWQRGLLFMLEGNNEEARKRFLASRQPGVKDWGVPDRAPAESEFYLRLIEQAEKATEK